MARESTDCSGRRELAWLEPGLAADVTRALRLRAAGYAVHTQLIPAEITPQNRLLIATPPTGSAGRPRGPPSPPA